MVEFIIDNKTFFIDLSNFNFDKERDYASNFIERFEKEEETFYIIWELNKSGLEEITNDVEDMIEMLNSIQENPEILLEYVKDIRKKKNGMFWRNSGTVIRRMDNCTDYFTDFTNAWSTPELRLDVIDENTCKLAIRERTYTH